MNSSYWGPKLARNVERDRAVNKALIADGWVVVRGWEHESVGEIADRVEEAVAAASPVRSDMDRQRRL
jgi:DNA mismatch endonuclease (patch repair protein)